MFLIEYKCVVLKLDNLRDLVRKGAIMKRKKLENC